MPKPIWIRYLEMLGRTPIKRPAPGVKRNNVLEDPFAQYLIFKEIRFTRQYAPIKDRKYRCDFYLPDYNVIIEIEGGQWVNGRHQRGTGFRADCEKYNAIVLAGYKIIRLTTDHFMRIGKDQYVVSGYSSTILDKIMESFEK